MFTTRKILKKEINIQRIFCQHKILYKKVKNDLIFQKLFRKYTMLISQ
jgi:hypothetical protein